MAQYLGGNKVKHYCVGPKGTNLSGDVFRDLSIGGVTTRIMRRDVFERASKAAADVIAKLPPITGG